jgi:cytoskeletal protein CcmA (bactofilin family)
MEFFKKDKDKNASSGRIPIPSDVKLASDSPAPPPPQPRRTTERLTSPPPAPPVAAALDDAFPEEPAAPPPPPRAESPKTEHMRSSNVSFPREAPREAAKETVINADAAFKGDFSSEGPMRIEGKVEGKVSCKGRLTIGKTAQVVGEAEVAQAVIEGALRGNIMAAERVELASSARVTGDIRAPRLVVTEGATLEGKVSIGVEAQAASSPSPGADRAASVLARDRELREERKRVES